MRRAYAMRFDRFPILLTENKGEGYYGTDAAPNRRTICNI